MPTTNEILRPGYVAIRDETGKIIRAFIFCQDCGRLEYLSFWANQSSWEAAGNPNIVCMPCFRQRLGRDLTQSDFAEAGIGCLNGEPYDTTYEIPTRFQLSEVNQGVLDAKPPVRWDALRLFSGRVQNNELVPYGRNKPFPLHPDMMPYGSFEGREIRVSVAIVPTELEAPDRPEVTYP
jgi:hypothetical protein